MGMGMGITGKPPGIKLGFDAPGEAEQSINPVGPGSASNHPGKRASCGLLGGQWSNWAGCA
jgi:hypothetical protein